MNLSKPCAAAIFFAAALTAHAQSKDAHWVGTWATAPVVTTASGQAVVLGPPVAPVPPPTAMPSRSAPDAVNGAGRTPRAETPAAITPPSPATVPARPAPPAPLGSSDITLRQTVHLSLGGSAVRIVFTNEYSEDPLTIGGASVTDQSASSDKPAKPTSLTFGGMPTITIPPGAIVLSDPLTMKVAAFSNLEVNLFLPAQKISRLTRHTGALQTSYTTPGDTTGTPFALLLDPKPTPTYTWTFLKSIDVLAPANAAAVVAFGDSITDGAYATRDANARWPDDLARRFAANPKTANLAVLNEGIGGNRVLHDNTGPSALARFNRDALDLAGVKYIIVLEAINDIGNAYRPTAPKDIVTADDLIQGYQQLIERAHLRGIKVILATLTPYGGATYGSPAGEKVRQAVNAWIRTTKSSDGMIDFDKATSDPAHPDTFLPAYDHGDHLHPTDAGLTAMANAIDLTLFTK